MSRGEHVLGEHGACEDYCPACGPACKHGWNSYDCQLCEAEKKTADIDDLRAAHEICRSQQTATGLVTAVGVGLSAARVDGYAAGHQEGLRKGFIVSGGVIAAEVDGWVLVWRGKSDQFMYDIRCNPQRDANDAPAAELLRKAPER